MKEQIERVLLVIGNFLNGPEEFTSHSRTAVAPGVAVRMDGDHLVEELFICAAAFTGFPLARVVVSGPCAARFARSQIRAQEARIKAANIADADTALIASIPGMGPILLSPIPGFPAFMLTDPLRLSKTFGFVDSMA